MECISCHTALDDEAAFCPHCGERQPNVPECDAPEYVAFISYRHREPDRATARWLHRHIETYRLPAAVARTHGSARLGRVFRDDDELPATGSLPHAIREALKRSAALVVVCSPATPESAWVQREIELFSSFHGRERIFAVLAEGKSSESIPESIRYISAGLGSEAERPLSAASPTADARSSAGAKARPGTKSDAGKPAADYEAATTPLHDSEPLAADLRPSSGRKRKREALRIIAALAGCSFDDLARRDKTRRARRIGSAIAAALCIAALMAALVMQASQSRHAANAAEAARLAALSREQLAHGDRYEAIESALDALAATGYDAGQPATEEAAATLEEALAVGKAATLPWHPAYSTTASANVSAIGETSVTHRKDTKPERIGDIACCEESGCFAICDNAGGTSTYDLETGTKLADCTLAEGAEPAGSELPIRAMGVSDKLVVSNPQGRLSLACFDPRTGRLVWETPSLAADALAPAPDQGGFCAYYVSDASLVCAKFDIETGNRVSHTANAAGEIASLPLARPELASVARCGELTVIATVDAYDGENLELGYSIEAFAANGKRAWSREGAIVSEMMESDDLVTLVLGWPTAQPCGFDGGSTIVATAGKTAAVLDAATGEPLCELAYASTVLDATPLSFGEDCYELLVTCADGSVTLRSATGAGYTAGDEYHHSFAERLRWAAALSTQERIYLLGASAEFEGRFVAYWTDFSTATAETREPSLEELVELGEAALSTR